MADYPNKLGLSLSGGGYRASAFHLGVLKKLDELDILQNVDVLSTISGGSITGAAWLLHKGDYNSFHEEIKLKLQTCSVIGYIYRSWEFIRTIIFIFSFIIGSIVLSFTNYSYLTIPTIIIFIFLFLKWQFNIFPVSRVIERAYNKFFIYDKKLSDLGDRPTIAIGASNLETGRPFTFSKTRMSDSTYTSNSYYDPPIVFLAAEFPLARAVMASSSVPGAFTPIKIDIEFFKIKTDFAKIHPQLVDGGVYDNQGIQKITQPKSRYECQIIITSDAGNQFLDNQKYPNSIALLVRTVGLFMNRIKTFQLAQNLYRNTNGPSRPIAYFSLGWKIENLIPGFIDNLAENQITREVIEKHNLEPGWVTNPKLFREAIKLWLEKIVGYEQIKGRDLTKEEWDIARKTTTNLASLSARNIDLLIKHAANLTELQIKLYCPMLIQNR
jgi:NTE family protein